MSDNFRLTRLHHQSSLADCIQEETEFCDVSLACEDQQVRAHKVVLAASSTKLRNILLSHPHPHPLIYLTGVRFSVLENIIRFIYHGEVDLSPDQVDSFLAVAKELQVKGLTDPTSASVGSKGRPNVKKKPPVTSKEYMEENIKTEAEEEEEEEGVPEAEERDIAVRGKNICPYCQRRKKAPANLERHIRRRHLRNHKKSDHFGEKPFSCPYCLKTFTLNHHLKDHFCFLYKSLLPV